MDLIKTLRHPFLQLIAGFLFSTIQASTIQAETKDQQLRLALRTIGHECLLQLNDSTSRVLPIEKVDGRYALKFEREFSFEPDLLFFATFKVLQEFAISDSFIVEVEACNTPKVVYSFEAYFNKKKNSIACKKRRLPMGCYVFYFTLIEKPKVVAEEKPKAVAKQKLPPVIEEKPKAVIEEKSKTVAEEKPKSIAKSTGWKKWIFPLFFVITGGGVLLFITRKRRPKPNAEVLNIGQFQFDQKGMRLYLNTQSIELSGKETDLLYLLNTNENKTLEREYILNIIWSDEGDYVGRTLDVFISKLRKKLEADPHVKIINVRGVGYRLVINQAH